MRAGHPLQPVLAHHLDDILDHQDEGIEGSYFTVVDFSRLPREAFHGAAKCPDGLPAARGHREQCAGDTLIRGFRPAYALWLGAASLGWLALAVFVFNRGLKRYASASS